LGDATASDDLSISRNGAGVMKAVTGPSVCVMFPQ
jgi:hypothetical protein